MSQGTQNSYNHDEQPQPNTPETEILNTQTLFQMITKSFNGNRSELPEFIRICDTAFRFATAVQKEALLGFVISNIHGNASSELQDQFISSWLDLKTLLLNVFSEKKSYTQLMEDLNTVKQGHNETVMQFYNRIKTVISRILNSLINKPLTERNYKGQIIREIALQRFIIHSKEEISYMLRVKEPYSLEIALDYAQNEERLLKEKRIVSHNQNKYVTDHRFQHKRPNHNPRSNDRFKPSNSNSSTPNLSNRHANYVPKTCRYCKNLGHTIEECRKLQRNRERKNVSSNPNTQQSVQVNTTQATTAINVIEPINIVRYNSLSEPLHPPRTSSSLPIQRNSLVKHNVHTINNSNISYVKFDINNSQFKLLIDTGANVSLIKYETVVKNKLDYDTSTQVTLNGLSPNSPISTIGTTIVQPNIHGHIFNLKLHIVPSQANVPFDGLIGNDFLKIENAEINFNKRLLKIDSLPFPITIHYDCSINDVTHQLPARSESIIQVNISNPHVKEGISPKMQLYEGVFLAKSVVKVNDNNKAITTILNTTDQTLKVSNITLELEEFDEPTSVMFNRVSTVNINQNRIKDLEQNLRLDHLNTEERTSVFDICSQFNDLFLLPGDNLSCTSSIEHEIITSVPKPVSSKIYRLPKVHENEVQRQITKMLNQGIIQHSVSPYNSPLWIVPKKQDASNEKKWRVVVDYRKLNEITVGDSYPIPNIEDILDQLGHSKYFTTLDLASGFHQIPMKPEHSYKTAFSTSQGHFEFSRMPYGLKNAPSTYQRLMNSVLTGLQGMQCFVYIDDIVIYASSLTEHEEKLRHVFSRLQNNNLRLQPDKCEFLHKEIAYLGHVITEHGVKPNPGKIIAISNYPKPQNEKQIKQFLGLLGYYRRFIRNFVSHAKPLTKLLKLNTPFVWTEEQEKSLDFLTSGIIKIEKKFETIGHLTGHNFLNRRPKRGILDGASYAFKWLFGTPDAADATYYSQSITALIAKNHEIELLMKQQVSILSSAINNYNESAQYLKANEKRLNNNINKFNEFAETAANTINSLSNIQLITDHLDLLTQLVGELNEELDVIMNSILFSKNNILHPSVITPVDLESELKKIQLRSDIEFPISVTEYNNIYKYFSICKLQVVFDSNILIFAIKIPLTSTEKFYLYNLIPLPTISETTTTSSYIDPKFPFLLQSTNRLKYSLLGDISTCTLLYEQEFICYNPTIKSTLDQPVCETLLNNKYTKTTPEDCVIRTVKANFEIWHPLSENTWLFVLSVPTPGTISCQHTASIIDVQLVHSGYIHLEHECKLYAGSTILHATSNYSSNYTNWIPNIDLEDDDCCIRQINTLKTHTMTPVDLRNLNLDELRLAQHKLTQFDEIIQRNINEPLIIKHLNWFSVLIASCLIFVILIVLCCCCGKCCNCSWIPFFGRLFPTPKISLFEVCINSKNSTSTTITRTRQNVEPSPMELRVIDEEPSTPTSYQMSKPIKIRSRRSLSRETPPKMNPFQL